MKMKLTDGNLNQCVLPPNKNETLYADDDLSGFGIRVRRDSKGKVRRKWFYQYRSKIDGGQHRVNLGNVDPPAAVSASKARQNATALSIQVQGGGNPQKEREAAKKARRVLLLESALQYLEDRRNGVIGKRPMRPATFQAAEHHFRKHWANLATRPVASITTEEVQRELRGIIDRNGKAAARRAKSNLSAFFSWGIKEGICKSNPSIATHDIAESQPRSRVLTDPEIRAIWSCFGEDDFGRIMRLLFFTGCRRSEIGHLSWHEIDLDAGVITIPGDRTKSGKELRLTLPPPAAEILRSAPRRADRQYLFGERGNAFARWSYEKLRIDGRLAAAGHHLAPWTVHDVRRTVRTRLSSIGIQPHIAELVLGHAGHRHSVDGSVYDHHTYEREIADALMRWSIALAAIVDPSPTGVRSRLFGNHGNGNRHDSANRYEAGLVNHSC
jgi:integrase